MELFSKPKPATEEEGQHSGFKAQYSLEERKAQYNRVVESHPSKIPVIVERASHSTIADIDKSKYLAPPDLTVSQFICLIRKRIKLSSDQALFIYINGRIPTNSALFSTIYEEYKDKDDGFLYVVYTGESTFGSP
jgi:GABA(A) receptor-associated protein